jgi:ubiquinone/menaquinone biosynthesis C-methylase UbiE
MFEKYYESHAYGEWCRRVYGKDLKQLGCVTMNELEILYQTVKLLSDSHILDMGCGSGYMSAEIASHYDAHLTGIDFDEDSITHAKKTFVSNPKFDFIHGDGSKVNFKESTFELICFCDSLHFTRTDKELYAVLDKCLNMLNPDGKLAILGGIEIQQVVEWGQNNNLLIQKVDLIETNKNLWRNVFVELVTMSSELRNEVPETYERIKGECIEQVKCNGWSPRWLYVLTKCN